MSDNDSDNGFELLSSQPNKDIYDFAPEDKLYKISVQFSRKFSYMLKKGTSLPHSTPVGGAISLQV